MSAGKKRVTNKKPFTPGELMEKPALSFNEVLSILDDLPYTTLQMMQKRVPVRWFLIGRRRYVMREDFAKWLEDVRDKSPAPEPV